MTSHDVGSDNNATQHVPGARAVMSLKLKVMIVTVLVGFGILHIIGATMIQRASGNQSIGAMMHMLNVD